MDVTLSIFGPTTPGESPQQVAQGLQRSGANRLLFFTSLYYGYRVLQRRYPQRAIYALEADRVFYVPDPSFYTDCSIQPERSVDMGDQDLLAGLVAACRAEGIRFSALVPMCAGIRLAQARPDLAVVNLYGSRDRLFLCYNNPEVRAYRLAMIREIASRYAVDALMLDKIPQTMLEARALAGALDPPLRTVGSFCFCPHCKVRARRSGLDLEEVQARCLALAARSLRIPGYVVEALGDQLAGDTEIPLLLLEEPLLQRMLAFRFETAVELIAEAGAVARAARPGIVFQVAFVPPAHIGHDATSPRSWLAAQSYKHCAPVVDEILCVVHWEPDVVRFETHRAVEAAEGRCKVITSMRLYGPTRPEDVPLLAEAALAGGSHGVSFLGYDVAGEELLKALAKWVAGRQ